MSIQSVRFSDRNAKLYHANAKRPQEEKPAKQLANCLLYLVKMTDYQLRQIEIHPDGEFHHCANGKEALDMVNHIKGVFRNRGFGCYALHNCIWIVPFVHQSLHLPDFERAKKVLPDLKSELLRESFPGEEIITSKSGSKAYQWHIKTALMVLIFIAIFALIF